MHATTSEEPQARNTASVPWVAAGAPAPSAAPVGRPISRVVRVALIALDGFTALTAIGGGIALATGLEANRFPPELLHGTPFSSYLAPGLVLAGVVGGSAAVATVATLRSPRLGAWASALAGTVLMGWIVGEVLLLRATEARSWVEAGYFGIGLLMAALGLLSGWAESRSQRPREQATPAAAKR